MQLKIYDTLHGSKRHFVPNDMHIIKMYGCGPTVYNRPHMGNLRSVLSYDVLFRTLLALYGDVKYARNITDVDDKIIDAAKRNCLSVKDIAEQYAQIFHEDVRRIFCLAPTVEPRATHYIDEMIDVVSRLLANGHAYIATDGVYFRVDSFDSYGKLSKRKVSEQHAGTRVAVTKSKVAAEDFALWKSCTDTPNWESPWGFGRPGWHIECSAMCHKELGETFDIHCGGEDLKFPHHENEIAQSLCAFPGSAFANYWMHTAFVVFDGDKMSKSIGNVYYLEDVLSERINAEVVRYAMLSTHYRKPININASIFETARESLDRIYDTLLRNGIGETYKINAEFKNGPFWEAILDDLNIPLAIKELHAMVSLINNCSDASGSLEQLIACSRFLGLLNYTPKQWFSTNKEDSTQIDSLLAEREIARSEKNYAKADEIRDMLKAMGIEVLDSKDGSTWRVI